MTKQSEVIWKPTRAYIEGARVKGFMDQWGIKTYQALYKRSIADITWFWPAAMDYLGVHWHRRYDTVLDLDGSRTFERARWFIGGKLSIAYNCLDRHALDPAAANRLAFIWETEDGRVEKWTYLELFRAANQCANALKALGVKKGVTVGLYMPMIPELLVAFWACMKLGAPLIPIFSGFGAKPLAVRLADAGARVLLTADVGFYKAKPINLKKTCDQAAKHVPSLEHIVVVQRSKRKIAWEKGRDLWWHEVVPPQSDAFETTVLDAEDLAMILYSSGTTGKPKGTLHRVAGVFAQVTKELGFHFDVKPDSRFYWITNIGWMMGPWQIMGVQHFGGCFVIYEGNPLYPDHERVIDMVARHRITHLGVSPTYCRSLKTKGEEWLRKYDLSCLKFLGSTGEPFDPESYLWVFQHIGRSQVPIINISGGTEMCGCLVSPSPLTPLKPCSVGMPGLGMAVGIADDNGKLIKVGKGHLVLLKPAPSLTRGFLGDWQRYLDTYFSWEKNPDVWYHGDYIRRDEAGQLTLHGRSDDTINVAGVRTGAGEVESALMDHDAVRESAVIGVPDRLKGSDIVCFVILKDRVKPSEALRTELIQHVAKVMGKNLRPRAVEFVPDLPRTRSMKIVRKAIRNKYLGLAPGDLASVENPGALDHIPVGPDL
ncbi:MAG: AMP-binding protein [Deltaproteobacteria bacterium]|nr:AMP-binding protein [Deltaproteobacteria bacterium]